MKNQFSVFYLVTLLLTITSFSVVAQKSADLKYSLNQGDNYNYVIDIDQDVTFDANGQTMALDQIMKFETVTLVAGVTPDSINLTTTINRVVMTQGIFGMTMTYDSDDPASAQNPMTAKIAESMGMVVGKSYTQVMDERGNVIRMDMGSIAEGENLADNLNSGGQFGLYPDHKVSVGDTWEKDLTPVKESDMKIHGKYTLLKLSGKQATIGYEGIISANTMQDMDMKLDGTQKGEMIVDVKTGWLIESSIDQDMNLDLEQNGQKFPATISGTIKTTSAKK